MVRDLDWSDVVADGERMADEQADRRMEEAEANHSPTPEEVGAGLLNSLPRMIDYSGHPPMEIQDAFGEVTDPDGDTPYAFELRVNGRIFVVAIAAVDSVDANIEDDTWTITGDNVPPSVEPERPLGSSYPTHERSLDGLYQDRYYE